MRYLVQVEDAVGNHKEYCVCVNVVNDSTVQYSATLNNNDEDGLSDIISLNVEAARAEYEHSFRRAERLDNKVYILLTVCGIIFVLLTNTIGDISRIDLGRFCNDGLVTIYVITAAMSIVGNLILLIMLIYSLSGKDYMRYDTNMILEKNLFSGIDRKSLARYTVMKYEKARDHNNSMVSRQFRRMNRALKLMIAVLILLMTVTILGIFVPQKEELPLNVVATISESYNEGSED